MLTSNSRRLFPLSHTATYLNHGGFGLVPHAVMEARFHHLRLIENNPTAFVVDDCRAQWRAAAALVAQRFALGENDVALICNATDGINAILRSLSFHEKDEILITSLSYGAITKAAALIAQLHGAKLVEAKIQFPNPSRDQCIDAIERAITPNTKLAIIDHVTSATALILPIQEMVALCHQHGVMALVDGAHVPGNIAFDINTIDADFYVANLHKWYFAPRACGFLWRSPTRQKHQNILPSVLSWDIDEGFPNSFAWTGTRDDSSWLCIAAAFAFMDQFGQAEVRAHNHALIRKGMSFLIEAWGMNPNTPDDMIGSMALVPLPKQMDYLLDTAGCLRFQTDLLKMHQIAIAPSFHHEGRIWARVSAQIYNEDNDYLKLAEAALAMR